MGAFGALAFVPDEAETQAFCDRLTDVTYRSYASNLAQPDLTPLPRGYRNLRVYDARDGAFLGSRWWVGSAEDTVRVGQEVTVMYKRPTARNVISICLGAVAEEITEWRSTSALPMREPGTLDLVVDIDTRSRELSWDGSPLPPHLVEFMTTIAPERAVGSTKAR